MLITPEMGVRGIATSGLGGRSFTRGVATATTVLASTAARADPAATALANATYLPVQAVLRCRADSIFPDTDLKGVEVTRYVGELTETEIETALNQGVTRAKELAAQGLIMGACFFVKGRMRATQALSGLLPAL